MIKFDGKDFERIYHTDEDDYDEYLDNDIAETETDIDEAASEEINREELVRRQREERNRQIDEERMAIEQNPYGRYATDLFNWPENHYSGVDDDEENINYYSDFYTRDFD